MEDMKLKFTNQQYQTDAVNSVINVFEGQPFNDHFTYLRDVEVERNLTNYYLSDEELRMGFANAEVQLTDEELLENIQKVQKDNDIPISKKLVTDDLGACSLDIEMETGTGKTYVYIKTMFELNKEYGWSKFIVVVPNIAIREGVNKSFKIMQDHFMEQYKKKLDFLFMIQIIWMILIVLVKVLILM